MLDVTPKITEQNRIVRTGKSEAEVTTNKKLRSRYCTIEATNLTTDRHEALRGLFATAELLVNICDSNDDAKSQHNAFCTVGRRSPSHWLFP